MPWLRQTLSPRQVATLVGMILGEGGAKSADLPVQRVDKLEPIINLKLAKEPGLTIPQALLAPTR
jgi:ABC-type uncharacterized transport system substrate-binding protein